MTDQQEREHWRWVGDWCTATASLLFLWDNRYGTQPVLMPGLTYYWWIEDDAAPLHQATEGDGGHRGRALIN